MDLFRRSIEIILDGQSPSGAYVACPNFPTYHYSWFRDGAFIAYAMDLIGEHDSAARFHAWAAACILERQEIVQRAINRCRAGQPLSESDILHTRYTLDGKDGVKDEWPNFQLDGFGTWLWALGEHIQMTHQLLRSDWAKASRLIADYLAALWRLPCFDCWEEFPEHVHTYTLAALYGGLRSQVSLGDNEHKPTLDAIKAHILSNTVAENCFVKAVGRTDVDASLIGLAVPYQVVAPDDPRMAQTIVNIEETLIRDGGGVHRYADDTYYGGGEWVQLTAWLGWYYAQSGQIQKARALLAWIEDQADLRGCLPEQIPSHLNAPSFYETWRGHWGEIASPLLWSHAKYLILKHLLS